MGYLGQKYNKGIVIQRSEEGSAFQEDVNVAVDGETEITPKVGGGFKKVTVTGAGGTEVIANPELEGNEDDLNSIEIAGVKYVIPGGGSADDSVINTDFYFELEQFRQIMTVRRKDGSQIQPETLLEWKDLLDQVTNAQYLLLNIFCIVTPNYSELVHMDYDYRPAHDEDPESLDLTFYSQYGDIDINMGMHTDDETGEDVVGWDIYWGAFYRPCNGFVELYYQDTTYGDLGDYFNLYDIALEEQMFSNSIYVDGGTANIQGYGGENVPPIEEHISEIEFWLEDTETGGVGHYTLYTAKGPIVVTLEVDAETGDTVPVVDWTGFTAPSSSRSGVNSFYVNSSTKKAIPVLEYGLDETYSIDEAYQLAQEVYAVDLDDGNYDYIEFNLPTYFIKNMAQPINLGVMHEILGTIPNMVEAIVIPYNNDFDDPIQPTITLDTDNGWREAYIRITDWGDFTEEQIKGLRINLWYEGE